MNTEEIARIVGEQRAYFKTHATFDVDARRRALVSLRDAVRANGQQIRLPIRMSSHPGPGIINIMIYHKHFASVLIYHPGRSRNMRNCIFSGKCVLIVTDPSQNQSFV